MSFSCAVPQQADEGIDDDAPFDMIGEDIPETPETPQTSPTDALISLDQALMQVVVAASLGGREVSVPAGLLAQMGLMLIDYRRSLELDGARVMRLPTLQERDRALTAYQDVCQGVATASRTIDCLLRGLR